MAENTTKTSNDTNKRPERKNMTQEERIAQRLERINRDAEKAPFESFLVHARLPEARLLVDQTKETEIGLTDLKMRLGSPGVDNMPLLSVMDRFGWAHAQLVKAIEDLNTAGFGTRKTLYELKEQSKKRRNRLTRFQEGSEEQQKLALELIANDEKRELEDIALIEKRIKEDAALAEKRAKEDEALSEKMQAAEEKAIEIRREEKETEKAEKRAAHEKRMLEQQKAKALKEKQESTEKTEEVDVVRPELVEVSA